MTADSPAAGTPGQPPRDQLLQAPGAQLRYRDAGHGPAVLLIHGWTLDLDMWEPQFSALTDHFRLIAWDRRGFGRSSGLPSLASDVADALWLCRHLGVGPLALVGMSQGARIALEFARVAPQQVACVVLDGPPDLLNTGAPQEDDLPLPRYRELARRDGAEAFRREWAGHRLAQLHSADRRAHEILQRMIARYPARDLILPDADPAPVLPAPALALASLQAPLLIINGALDVESRRGAADLLRPAARVERALISGAGHLPNLDNPADYNRVLGDFLRRHALPAAAAPA